MTLEAAVDEAVTADVQNRLLYAIRFASGGNREKSPGA